jgi:hypothetical protein
MADKMNKSGDKAQSGDDSEEKLQKELERASKEGSDSIGDVGSDRNLSGASSWETLPDKSEPVSPRKNEDSA